MNSLTDQRLLRDYSEGRSEAAFAELVRRHVDMVYSAALRMVCDAHLAEDVTQGVFVALARSAARLTDRPVLDGWLHRTTQNLAANAVRSEVRRRVHEQEAAAMNELLSTEPDTTWESVAPHLDAALGELSDADRDALLLRYFQNKSAREIAQALGVSDEAAQKRISRAVERLREFFAKRGVAVGASGLAAVLSANAVQAAPVALTATLASGALASAAAGSGTLNLLTVMATTKVKVGVISAVLAVSTAATLVIEHTSQARIREAGVELEQQAGQVAQLQAEHERLSNRVALAVRPAANTSDEAQKLRDEVALLEGQAKGLAALREEHRRLQASASKVREGLFDPNEQDIRGGKEVDSRVSYCMELAMAAMNYASKHQDQWPADLERVVPFLRSEALSQTNLAPAQFEIVYQGTRASAKKYAHPNQILLVRQRQPSLNADGQWVKAYSFLAGNGRQLSLADGNYEGWEQQHMAPPEPSTP